MAWASRATLLAVVLIFGVAAQGGVISITEEFAWLPDGIGGWVLEIIPNPDVPPQDISNVRFLNEPPESQKPVAESPIGVDVYDHSVLDGNGYGGDHKITIYFNQVVNGQQVHIEAQYENPDEVLFGYSSYPIPEPATAGLVLAGLALAGCRKRR